MKTIYIILISTITLLIACASGKSLVKTNSQKLISAIQEGDDFYASDITFEEDFNFDEIVKTKEGSIYLKSQLVFTNCTFKGKFSWSSDSNRRLYFEKEVIFKDCTFEEDLVLNETIFRSRLQIVDCLFRKNLNLDRNTFLIKSNIDKNEIGQNISTQYIQAHENFSIFENTIGNNLLLQGAIVSGLAQFSTNQLNGSIDLTKSRFQSDLLMNYTKGGKKLLAGNMTVIRKVQMIDVSSFKIIDLTDAFILGSLKYTHLDNTLPQLENAHIGDRIK
jgi:hypothetical protein